MKEITEKKQVVGTLLAQGQEYWMLDLSPNKHRNTPMSLREDTFEFYVIVDGYAHNIIVSRGSFAIIPLLADYSVEVRFIVEGEEPIEVTKFEQDILEARIDLASFYQA